MFADPSLQICTRATWSTRLTCWSRGGTSWTMATWRPSTSSATRPSTATATRPCLRRRRRRPSAASSLWRRSRPSPSSAHTWYGSRCCDLVLARRSGGSPAGGRGPGMRAGIGRERVLVPPSSALLHAAAHAGAPRTHRPPPAVLCSAGSGDMPPSFTVGAPTTGVCPAGARARQRRCRQRRSRHVCHGRGRDGAAVPPEERHLRVAYACGLRSVGWAPASPVADERCCDSLICFSRLLAAPAPVDRGMLLDRVRAVASATDYLELLTQTSYGFVRPSQIGTRAAYVLRTAFAGAQRHRAPRRTHRSHARRADPCVRAIITRNWHDARCDEAAAPARGADGKVRAHRVPDLPPAPREAAAGAEAGRQPGHDPFQRRPHQALPDAQRRLCGAAGTPVAPTATLLDGRDRCLRQCSHVAFWLPVFRRKCPRRPTAQQRALTFCGGWTCQARSASSPTWRAAWSPKSGTRGLP